MSNLKATFEVHSMDSFWRFLRRGKIRVHFYCSVAVLISKAIQALLSLLFLTQKCACGQESFPDGRGSELYPVRVL